MTEIPSTSLAWNRETDAYELRAWVPYGGNLLPIVRDADGRLGPGQKQPYSTKLDPVLIVPGQMINGIAAAFRDNWAPEGHGDVENASEKIDRLLVANDLLIGVIAKLADR